jgi:hypothetical protein
MLQNMKNKQKEWHPATKPLSIYLALNRYEASLPQDIKYGTVCARTLLLYGM